MSEFKVGDDVFIKAKIVKLPSCGDSGYLVVSNGDLMSHWESEVYPILEKTYEDGLNEAWKLAREIYKMDGPTMGSVFGSWEGSDAYCLSIHEAMDKVKKWKDEKAIHVNDVVEHKGLKLKGLITSAEDNGDDLHILWENGKQGRFVRSKDSLEKTGRTIDIESLLKQIGGVE